MALSTSCRSTLLTTSNDGSATARSLLSSPAHQAGCPSGQREQTVNLPAQPTKVRTLHPPPPACTAPTALRGQGLSASTDDGTAEISRRRSRGAARPARRRDRSAG